MSYNGSGTFLINSAGQPVVANTVISATVFNALTADLATGLSTAITKDGQTTITANIPFGSNKITALGAGTAATDAANLGQVQSTVAKLITVTGTDTITGSMSPALTAYAAGQLFYFVSAGANTGAVTINIDSLGAKSITRDGSSALAAGDINSGEVVVVIYDGTRFQMINAANSFGNTTINGTLTVTGNAGFQANVSITSALSVGGVFAVTGAATFTANPTLSGGTANGVLYLNGSKVATSGSALTFTGTNLGIGVASPVALLQVQGVQQGVSGKYLRLSYNATYYSEYSEQSIQVYNNDLWFGCGASGSEQMRLTSTGLGIGTASPTNRLTVKQPADNSSAGLGLKIERNSNDSLLYVGYLDSSDAWQINATYSSTGAFKPITFRTSDTERLRLDTSGNLGLGVTPSAWASNFLPVLQIKTGTAGVATLCGTANDNFRVFCNAYYDGAAYKRIGAGYATVYQQDTGGHYWFTAGTSTAGSTITFTQAMTLDASGNLGLGTSSPTAYSGYVTFAVNGSSGGQIDLMVNGTNKGAFFSSSTGIFLQTTSGSSLPLIFRTDSVERARIIPSGYSKFSNDGTYRNVTSNYHEFVQTANDTGVILTATNASFSNQVLYLNTTRAANSAFDLISANGNDVGQFRVRGDGTIYAQNTTVQSISDGRLKENVSDATDGLNVINALRPVRYDWKAGYGNDRKNQLGFIAQEMEAIFPEAVAEWKVRKDEEAYKTVGPGALIPVLVKAMQEQQAMINELKAKVAALEA